MPKEAGPGDNKFAIRKGIEKPQSERNKN